MSVKWCNSSMLGDFLYVLGDEAMDDHLSLLKDFVASFSVWYMLPCMGTQLVFGGEVVQRTSQSFTRNLFCFS